MALWRPLTFLSTCVGTYVPGLKTHGHASTGVLDFRRRKFGAGGQFPHLDGSPAPLLDNPTEVEDPCYERVPGQRFMGLEQSLGSEAEVQRPRRGHFEAAFARASRRAGGG